tara:strand:+ start:2670 stop:3431 length:762 start_codon:yes stop_codon:yes gene_type:complete
MARVQQRIQLEIVSPDISNTGPDDIHTNQNGTIQVRLTRSTVNFVNGSQFGGPSSDPSHYLTAPFKIACRANLYIANAPSWTTGYSKKTAYPYYKAGVTTNLDSSFDTDPNGHTNYYNNYFYDSGDYYVMGEGIDALMPSFAISDLYETSYSDPIADGYITDDNGVFIPLTYYMEEEQDSNLYIKFWFVTQFLNEETLSGDINSLYFHLSQAVRVKWNWNGYDTVPTISLNPISDVFIGQNLDLSWSTSDGTT